MHTKDTAGFANSVDPHETAPLGAVWSGSALFAHTYLSEKLGSLWSIYWQNHTIQILAIYLGMQEYLGFYSTYQYSH